MVSARLAAVYSMFIAIVILFQLGLALAMPWGELAMAGQFPGVFPPFMRLLALLQIGLLVFFLAVVCTRARLIWPKWFLLSQKLIWLVVFLNGLSVLMNLMTPSLWERIVWSPVALILFGSSLGVALSKVEISSLDHRSRPT